MPRRPPRLAQALLRLAYRGDAREAIAGDLEEEFQEVLQQRGSLQARRWYWRQAFRSVVARRSEAAPAVTQTSRDAFITSLSGDIRFGTRLLARTPGYTILAIATIALGIATTVAISSVAYAVLLRPLPYGDEDRVVMVWETDPANGYPTKGPSPPNYLDWVQRAKSFSSLGALAPYEASLTGAGEPVRLTGRRINASAFAALGTAPALGRPFLATDERAGNGVAIISHRVWTTHFGSDPAVVGRTIQLNNSGRVVVGVMGANFRLPGRQDDVLVPFVFSDGERQARGSHFLEVVARLAPGMQLEQAQSEMDAIAADLAQEYPRWNAKEGALVEPIRQQIVGEVRTAMLVITGAAALVLLIACVNVANLQIVRGVGRAGEMAVRRALGAGRVRIARQLLTESTLLAVGGGATGLLLAVVGVEVLRTVLPPALADIADIRVDRTIFAIAALLTLGTGLIAGLAPVLHAWQPAASGSLSEGHRTSSGVRTARTRHALVAAEVALAVVLLVCAGLLLRSFARLSSIDPGFATANRLTFRVELPRGRYGTPAKWSPFMDALTARLEALPGVIAAGGTSWLPLADSGGSNGLYVEGRPLPQPGESTFAIYRLATPGYFRAMGITIVRGRAFDNTDTVTSPRVGIVNETLAARTWPNEDPLGKRVSFSRNPTERDWITVIGIARDARITTLTDPAAIALYGAHTQDPNWFPPTHIVVHTSGDPLGIASAAREQVRALDASVPMADVKPAGELVAEQVAEPRFQSLLITSFGAAALALAAVGIYGMLSFSAAARRREFAVRLALGAAPTEIVRIVLSSAIRVTTAGLVAGGVLAAIAARSMATLLHDIRPFDGIAFAAAGAGIAVIAVAAACIPARRAARVDPAGALKLE
jgi:putative ABC transport system permease protein